MSVREWMQSPQLRAGDQADGPRSATWLELFFDLVFVVAVAELAHNLSENVSVLEFLAFAGLFVPVWWAWIGSTFYATRFDTDDLVHRLFTAIEIFLVVVLAVNIHDGFGATSGGFALAYAAIRGLLVFKYYMAGRNVPKAKPLTTRYTRGFGLAAVVWLVSVFVPTPYRFGLWAIGLLISFVTPITAGDLHGEIPPHALHLPERFGLFTIIVLGEAIVAVVTGVADQTWSAWSVAAAVGK